MLKSVLQPVLKPILRGVKGVEQRKAYNFDGINDRAQFAKRAIDPAVTNYLEFWSPVYSLSAQTIISQNIAESQAEREFQLFVSGSGALQIVYGGVLSTLLTRVEGFTPSRKYFLELGENFFTLAVDSASNIVKTAAYTRGAAREPTAPTVVGARQSSAGLFAVFFQGLQYDLKINGVLWPFENPKQLVQLPMPNELGTELATAAVLESPFALGSQWQNLGNGKFQYNGDGSFNTLVLLEPGAQPAAGFLEFEVEAITGTMRCYSATAAVNTVQSNPVFSAPGVYRHFVTDRNSVAAGSSWGFQRQAAGAPASCVIKNISFKPLADCNPAILVNTTSDRWQDVI